MSKFIAKKSQKMIDQEEREIRLEQRKKNPKANPTNKDIYEFLIDVHEIQNEIQEMLKMK